MPSSGLIQTITLPNGNTYDVKDSALPVVSSSDNGKVLTVSGGIWSAETPQSSMPTVLSVTAAAGSWTSATPPTQTISATGVTASNTIVVSVASTITQAQYNAAVAGKLICTAQGAGEITLTCYGAEPSENIPLTVTILG